LIEEPAMSHAVGIAARRPREAPGFRLDLPPTRLLTSAEKLALLEDRFHRGQASTDQRRSFVIMLMQADRFEDALTVLSGSQTTPDFSDLMALGTCRLARETPADSLAALTNFLDAATAAPDARGLAFALAEAGKACIRLRRVEDARECLRAALGHNKHNANAYKRLNRLEIETGDAARALADTDDLIAAGVSHSRVLCGRAMALSALGRVDEARLVLGLDRFLCEDELAPPSGWRTIADFNLDLIGEITAHPGKSGDQYGAASVAGTRLNEPMIARAPLFGHLLEQLRRHICAYVAGFDRAGHPFLAATPQSAILRAWAITTHADGYEEWHVHQNGWLSGVYYVDVPDRVQTAIDEQGCLCFGALPNVVGEKVSDMVGRRLIRPRPGKILMFPSHVPHRTFPHGRDARRICVAFDVIADQRP
jgi:uncharacterized protein (TIGR02466 family)